MIDQGDPNEQKCSENNLFSQFDLLISRSSEYSMHVNLLDIIFGISLYCNDRYFSFFIDIFVTGLWKFLVP